MSTCVCVLMTRFMRQGHFDQLRKQMLRDFLQSERHAAFREQLESYLHDYVSKDAERLAYRDARLRQSDIMHALDQHPLFDELVSDLSKQGKESWLGEGGRLAEQVREQVTRMIQAHASSRQE